MPQVLPCISRCWGLGFWVYLLANSAFDLSKLASKLFQNSFDLTAGQWCGLVANLVFFGICASTVMVRWSAVLVRRAFILGSGHRWLHHLLAPIFVAGFYRATWSRIAKAWGLVIFIVVIGIIVANLPYPWRQIIDLGVVINLLGGTVALLAHTARAVVGKQLPKVSGDFPAGCTEFDDNCVTGGPYPQAVSLTSHC
ncbi:unnamed protein product [Polarella glacialis]|uniref:Uncharacterized protein n=1 Tax=Polarella glacialis TaxID=89957 RepID=A0A813I2D4_POLGL|nr:unnamed protein product [Polarella glacialis]CAE8599261.1 unnamed protein product [Polarella glacialis]CAE8644581.1 unnamed protein product [Polarella glacialis]CAE8650735.1 unnamed protein product [Polarella glacialis]|mmetsp:Transcript_24391/g.39093  ORF Transcript_24391/g.39093 Transcript_24391/m.39093 type:complete len:197 (-) Transcript_24391:80-670(-)